MKNYLVIGGSSGIGAAIVQQLSREGHRVLASYFKNVRESENSNIIYFPLDVTNPAAWVLPIPETLDGLVYCPGSVFLKPFHRVPPEQFTADFELQVNGAIRALQYCLPALKASGNASIVLFSTVAVQAGFNFHSAVSTSKGAIEGLTRALAAEWAPDIRVNAIAPSLTDTQLAAKLLSSEEKKSGHAQRHPLKKIGTPEIISEAACYLLSDRSNWVTGQILAVDGGMSSIRG